MKEHLLHLFILIHAAASYGPHHPRGPHRHHRPDMDGGNTLTKDSQLLQDKEHIQEDLKEVLPDDATDNMTPEELEFYYFKIHDSDNNTKLDGLEILRAVQHTVHENEEEEDISRLVGLIDNVFLEDDLDNDGYLSYIEFASGRNRDQTSRQYKKT